VITEERETEERGWTASRVAGIKGHSNAGSAFAQQPQHRQQRSAVLGVLSVFSDGQGCVVPFLGVVEVRHRASVQQVVNVAVPHIAGRGCASLLGSSTYGQPRRGFGGRAFPAEPQVACDVTSQKAPQGPDRR